MPRKITTTMTLLTFVLALGRYAVEYILARAVHQSPECRFEQG